METEPSNIAEWAERIGRSYSAERAISFDFAGITSRCRTNSAELVAKLDRYFRGFVIREDGPVDFEVTALEADPLRPEVEFIVKRPDPGKMKIKEEYVDYPDGRIVRKRLTDMIFLFGNGINLAVGPCTSNDNQIINFINNRFIQYHLNRDCILGHAAAARLDDYGLALAGFSGAGKSTLCLNIMGRGATFISNDRLLVRKDGDGLAMMGVAKLPRVNPGTLLNNEKLITILSDDERVRFDALPEDELWGLEHKYDVFVDEVFGEDKLALSAGMKGLVILNWKRGGGPTRFEEIDLDVRRDLLSAFIKSPGLFYEPEGLDGDIAFSEDAYVDHLKRCRVFEVTGGVDFDHAGNVCMQLMNEGS